MLYINQTGDRKISIRKVENGITVNNFIDFATWKATIGAGGLVTVKDMTGNHPGISEQLTGLVINGAPAPADRQEALELLGFIGSFKPGGGSSGNNPGFDIINSSATISLYIDAANGDDSNDGRSAQTPVKTESALNGLINRMIGIKGFNIYFAPGTYVYFSAMVRANIASWTGTGVTPDEVIINIPGTYIFTHATSFQAKNLSLTRLDATTLSMYFMQSYIRLENVAILKPGWMIFTGARVDLLGTITSYGTRFDFHAGAYALLNNTTFKTIATGNNLFQIYPNAGFWSESGTNSVQFINADGTPNTNPNAKVDALISLGNTVPKLIAADQRNKFNLENIDFGDKTLKIVLKKGGVNAAGEYYCVMADEPIRYSELVSTSSSKVEANITDTAVIKNEQGEVRSRAEYEDTVIGSNSSFTEIRQTGKSIELFYDNEVSPGFPRVEISERGFRFGDKRVVLEDDLRPMGREFLLIAGKYSEAISGICINTDPGAGTSGSNSFFMLNIVINDIKNKTTAEFNANWIDSTSDYDMVEMIRNRGGFPEPVFKLYGNSLWMNFSHGANSHLAVKVRVYEKDTASGIIRPTEPVITLSEPAGNWRGIPVTNRVGSYSTQERLTGALWIDGRAIYQRTFSGTKNLTANTNTVLVSHTGVGFLIKGFGVVSRSATAFITIPGRSVDASEAATHFVSDITQSGSVVSVTVRSDVAISGAEYYVTLQYVK